MADEPQITEPVCVSPAPPEKTLYLAKWSSRFWAWLIDIILVTLSLNIVHGILEPVWVLPFYWDVPHWDPFAVGFLTLFFFLYWTIMEGFRGQSIGKMVMNLKVVNREGTKINYWKAAIESFRENICSHPHPRLPDRVVCHARNQTPGLQPDIQHYRHQDRLQGTGGYPVRQGPGIIFSSSSDTFF